MVVWLERSPYTLGTRVSFPAPALHVWSLHVLPLLLWAFPWFPPTNQKHAEVKWNYHVAQRYEPGHSGDMDSLLNSWGLAFYRGPWLCEMIHKIRGGQGDILSGAQNMWLRPWEYMCAGMVYHCARRWVGAPPSVISALYLPYTCWF